MIFDDRLKKIAYYGGTERKRYRRYWLSDMHRQYFGRRGRSKHREDDKSFRCCRSMIDYPKGKELLNRWEYLNHMGSDLLGSLTLMQLSTGETKLRRKGGEHIPNFTC